MTRSAFGYGGATTSSAVIATTMRGTSFESFRRAHLAVDHLKPSGGDDDSNLVTCCAACNADKAARTSTRLKACDAFCGYTGRNAPGHGSTRSLRPTTDQKTLRIGIGRSASKRFERVSRQGTTSQNEPSVIQGGLATRRTVPFPKPVTQKTKGPTAVWAACGEVVASCSNTAEEFFASMYGTVCAPQW
jgi:hypothetical protein